MTNAQQLHFVAIFESISLALLSFFFSITFSSSRLPPCCASSSFSLPPLPVLQSFHISRFISFLYRFLYFVLARIPPRLHTTLDRPGLGARKRLTRVRQFNIPFFPQFLSLLFQQFSRVVKDNKKGDKSPLMDPKVCVICQPTHLSLS